ncbi:MAG TPA: PHP domain-containing protein [Woeseiaceae bacterium]|nr:PHP domain-containing protein [Woeseiaceae bacterium]
MLFDLHCHTTASDGALAPAELLARARDNGVGCIAITDHDTLDAYRHMGDSCSAAVALCHGIELSATWQGRSVHVVGLNVRLACDGLQQALATQRQSRLLRAEIIAKRLAQKGIHDALAGAMAIAGDGMIGRPHFARFLVASGKVRDEQQAFRRYLGQGKPGDVESGWPSVATVTAWIREAGGTAVLAHPGHYRMTNSKLGVLADEFVRAGGTAMEVVSGRQAPALTRKLADLANSKQLLASTGSDFHRPGPAWSELGHQSVLPDDVPRVWDSW